MFLLACRFRPGLAPHVLVTASVLFCFLAGPVSLVFLGLSIVGNFAVMGVIRRLTPGSSFRRLVTAGAVLANLAPFVAFKLAQQWGWPWSGTGSVPAALPLGLAFYTLQQITFLIDAQKSGQQQLDFPRFAAWGSFFGQLPAGPIGSWSRMAPQFARLGLGAPAATEIARGLTLVLAGIVKKTWLADPMARKVDAVLTGADLGAVTPLEAWTAAWGYMLQLYFDFSAYSDVAIGVGLCFGLILPINFDSPLKAATPGQYVMRWHISMMTFVRDRIFEPTFRIARKLPIRPTSRRYGIAWAMATLVAYLAVAAWHTAAPLPLFVGLCVALLLIGLQFLRQSARSATRPPVVRAALSRKIAGRVALLAAASVAALFLRASPGAQMEAVMSALADLPALTLLGREAGAHALAVIGLGAPVPAPGLYPNAGLPGLRTLAMTLFATGVVLASPNTMQIFGIAGTQGPESRLRWRPTALWGVLTVVLLMFALIGITRPVEPYGFIYARF